MNLFLTLILAFMFLALLGMFSKPDQPGRGV